MASVIWTEPALTDLEAACLYIARDAPRAAEVFADRVFHATDRLTAFPRSGRVVPEARREDLREIIVGNHRIIYRLLPDEAVVLTVIHGARRLDVESLEGSS